MDGESGCCLHGLAFGCFFCWCLAYLASYVSCVFYSILDVGLVCLLYRVAYLQSSEYVASGVSIGIRIRQVSNDEMSVYFGKRQKKTR